MSDSDVRDQAARWYYLEHFGFAKAPPQSDREVVRNMAVALLTAANGDGHLSAEERAWIVGYFAAKGYPAEVVSDARAQAPSDLAAVPALMENGILKKSGRILVYDAIRAASVDGYDPGERKAVRAVASSLGIDEASVAALEALVAEETALRQKRIKLLMPDGHPNLDSRYQP